MAVMGCIGTGCMGSALVRAAARGGRWEKILLANRSREKAERLARETGGRATDSAAAAAEADYLLLGVEPGQMEGLIREIRPVLRARETAPVVVSMAAGVEMDALRTWLGEGIPRIRIMPNIPAAAGAGVILWCAGAEVTDRQRERFLAGMEEAGRFVEMKEERMKAATGITGCGPAYAALFAEALADGGVACGVPRAQARELAALTMLGAAKMLLEEGTSPAELKDRVCSPGGSTIQGVRALERFGLRSAVTEAVIAAFEKTFESGDTPPAEKTSAPGTP